MWETQGSATCERCVLTSLSVVCKQAAPESPRFGCLAGTAETDSPQVSTARTAKGPARSPRVQPSPRLSLPHSCAVCTRTLPVAGEGKRAEGLLGKGFRTRLAVLTAPLPTSHLVESRRRIQRPGGRRGLQLTGPCAADGDPRRDQRPMPFLPPGRRWLRFLSHPWTPVPSTQRRARLARLPCGPAVPQGLGPPAACSPCQAVARLKP